MSTPTVVPNRRQDWVTRQYASIGLDMVRDVGRVEGARYMCRHGVPIHVALRLIWNETKCHALP